MQFKVRLNGTAVNPWHKMGLTQNPFPQIAKAELDFHMRAIASLDGEPLAGPDDIRERLKVGFSSEFVQYCVDKFKPGERVEFQVVV